MGYQSVNPSEIEKIFGARFEEPKDEFLEETIKKIESYGAKYDSDSFGGSAEDQLMVCEAIAEAEQEEKERNERIEKIRFKVKGNQGSMVTNVSYDPQTDILTTKKQSSSDGIAFKLAEALDDLDSLPYYEKLVRERRSDFLRNCFIITLKAFKRGAITKSKAAYFTGVIKQRTALQERIKRYKEKHTT